MSKEFLKALGVKKSFKELKASRTAKEMVASAREEFKEPKGIPLVTYTLYREYKRFGGRQGCEAPYFLKRKRFALAVVAAYLTKEQKFLDLACDHIINICEESTWVLPAHERHSGKIDLFSADTGLELAEAVGLLADIIPAEITERVKSEVEKRIFAPYLKYHREMFWHKCSNNWNGVCNSCVGAAFLHLETDKKRLKKALKLVLQGLEAYVNTAFEADGGSTEGVSYWIYGLNNYVLFSELLRHKTKGRPDLLAAPGLKKIAQYPLKLALAKGVFANFADCEEKVYFTPGMIIKLSGRTNLPELLELLNPPRFLQFLYLEIRNLFWQKDKKTKLLPFSKVNTDSYLKSTQVVKLTAKTASKKDLVLIAKAGHNEENHNHNDVGSFILHVNGENLICDPGTGLYSRDYFTAKKRYENVFCSSYGHNVPVAGKELQKHGKEFAGKVTAYDPGRKRVEIEFAKAYGAPGIKSIRRNLLLKAKENTAVLEDNFLFKNELAVEEAFLSWFPVKCKGNTALIRGKKSTLEITIAEPKGAVFSVKKLERECKANAKPGALSRLAFTVPKKSKNIFVQIIMKIS